MKKLFLSLQVLLLTLALSGSAFAYLADNNPAVVREVGTVADPYREYSLVRYAEADANGTSLSANDVVVWDCISQDGVTVNVASTASSTDAVAGVVVATIPTADSVATTVNSMGRRNWGYIQTKGHRIGVNVTAGVTVAGGAIRAASTARAITKLSTPAATNTNVNRCMGFSYTTSDTAGSAANIIWIDL